MLGPMTEGKSDLTSVTALQEVKSRRTVVCVLFVVECQSKSSLAELRHGLYIEGNKAPVRPYSLCPAQSTVFLLMNLSQASQQDRKWYYVPQPSVHSPSPFSWSYFLSPRVDNLDRNPTNRTPHTNMRLWLTSSCEQSKRGAFPRESQRQQAYRGGIFLPRG